jgi:hypothetical protein
MPAPGWGSGWRLPAGVRAACAPGGAAAAAAHSLWRGAHARLRAVAAGWRGQRRRSIMTTSTMITIRTMVPMPIDMGFLSDARRPCGTELRVPGWAGAGRDGSLSRAPPGDAARGLRQLVLEDRSLIFSPACLRSPLA